MNQQYPNILIPGWRNYRDVHTSIPLDNLKIIQGSWICLHSFPCIWSTFVSREKRYFFKKSVHWRSSGNAYRHYLHVRWFCRCLAFFPPKRAKGDTLDNPDVLLMRNHVAVHHYSPGADLGGGGAVCWQHLFPTMHAVMADWLLQISQRRRIYTTGTGKVYKPGLPPPRAGRLSPLL